MSNHIRPADIAAAAVAFSIFFVLLYVQSRVQHFIGTIAVSAGMLAALVLLILLSVRRIQKAVDQSQQQILDYVNKANRTQFKQLEAIVSIYHVLKPVAPLTATRGWAASPDFLQYLIQTIKSDRPSCIVEASSGVSTVVSAYCLQELGHGHVYALEHEAQYAQATREQLSLHGLEEFATVIDAPLRSYRIGSDDWLWYDADKFDFGDNIDLLVIDGPPKKTQALARFPALPLLEGRVLGIAKILMDDGARPDEKEIVRRWKLTRAALTSQYIPLEKGAFELCFR